MSTKKEYAPINLPKGLVEELKVWKAAYSASYGTPVTYEKMIRGMLDSLEDSDPAVHQEYVRILEKHPELMEKFNLGND